MATGSSSLMQRLRTRTLPQYRRWGSLAVALVMGASLLVNSPPAYAQVELPPGLMPVPSTSGGSVPALPPPLESPPLSNGAPSSQTPPSLQDTRPQPVRSQDSALRPNAAASLVGQGVGPGGNNQLPSGAGQVYVNYDLRPYTGYLSKADRPHQAVVDWVLRDTGTDMWFTEPFGYLSANRDTLTVYHTPEVHQVVRDVVDKFVAGSKDPQAMGLRVLTIGSPNWRTRAVHLMEHVNVGSPGVQAWLVTKENAALLLAQLRQRTDTREIQSLDIAMYNGQAESLDSTRRRNYVRSIRPAPAGWPPYEPETGEIEEGYRLEISPLLNVDGATLDCVIRASIDQVEKLVPVDLDLPLPNGQVHRARVQVPQVASWRLHERFRWPMDRVLVLSCGVIASPDRPQSSLPLINIDSLTGQTAGRADALLFIEFKGRASENLPLGTRVASPNATFNRGRY